MANRIFKANSTKNEQPQHGLVAMLWLICNFFRTCAAVWHKCKLPLHPNYVRMRVERDGEAETRKLKHKYKTILSWQH